MRRRWLPLVSLLMMVVGLTLSVVVCLAVQVETKQPAGKTYKFRFGTIQPADAPVGRGAAKFAELVGVEAGGRVTVDVYPASQLGNEKDLIDAVEMGTLEFALGGVAEWAKGIVVGIFTPTEAAIVAVFYSIVIGFYYRSLSPRDLPRLVKETLGITVNVFFIVASAALFGLILTISQVPQQMAVSFTEFVPNKYVALLTIIESNISNATATPSHHV